MPSSPPQPLSPIPFIGMTRQRFTPGRALGPPRVLVIHATAGRHPGDLGWLARGGGDPPLSPVSCHYYIDTAGRAVQLVRDTDTAWHTGPAAWTVDGAPVSGSYQGVARLNHLSIGIELSNLNTGADPYPAPQVAAAIALARALVALHQIPRHQLVRHLDISPGRKSDPAGLPWRPFVEAVYADEPPSIGYTAQSPIMGRAPAPPSALIAAFARLCARHRSPYATETPNPLLDTIGPAYAERCAALGVDLAIALAQVGHETGWLTSALSQREDKDGRPLRNPAGIGVWERRELATPTYWPNTVWDADAGGYRPATQFRDWRRESVPAHVGRLLAWATPPPARTVDQRLAVETAMRFRELKAQHHGSAQRLVALGKAHNTTGAGWASPGLDYGAKLAEKANLLLREAVN